MSLRNEVNKFRVWALGYPAQERSGEWECDYPGWSALHAETLLFIAATPFANWSTEEINDVLYAVARDNEIEYLAKVIAKSPDLLLALSKASIDSSEPDAKWQLAVQLGQQPPSVEAAEKLLLKLVNDEDEYVSRRALLSLGAIQSSSAVSLAKRAWTTGHEYQRIAALWVIKDCAPEMLQEYVDKAHQDGRHYVIQNAREVQA